ncbi:hypothetical protein BPNPMPFG_006295 [Mesorhizobium sp. AR07]|uniref:hypothetical protein n=1 Tax=Mesorhizobium sp. AR07 TaxID=2865838 RepID=UPI00215E4DE8|nr:hypothetical protein [Mesorhizobium sp. AR07]UVK44380.1 hypothetical protein BPNPMPFG_006295 [Mesorhizobium sp. AR07]
MTDLDRSQLRMLADEMHDRFGDVGYDALAVVPIMWAGWECDSFAVLVRLPDAKHEIVFPDGTGMSGQTSEQLLESRIREYERVTQLTRVFLDRLKAERAFAIIDGAPDVPPEPGDEVLE